MVKTKKDIKDKKTNIEDIIKEVVADLLLKLNISGDIEVVKNTTDETSDNNFNINIKSEETGLLIGHHGETLNSMQLILGVILYKKLGIWTRVILDVGDYRKMREESIKEMVTRMVGEVEANSTPVVLPFLTPLERRIVHMMLADNPKVTSESIGEGRDRRVTIKLR